MVSLNNTEDNEEKIVDLENVKIIKSRVWEGFQVTIPFLSHLNFWQNNFMQDLNKNNKTFI